MEKISKLQVSATVKIPEGKLEEFKQRAAEVMKQIGDKGTGALKYDWFISSDQTECEVREEYKSSEDVLEHGVKFMETLTKFFNDFPLEHTAFYGDPSPQLLEVVKKYNPDAKLYSFFQGLEEMIEA